MTDPQYGKFGVIFSGDAMILVCGWCDSKGSVPVLCRNSDGGAHIAIVCLECFGYLTVVDDPERIADLIDSAVAAKKDVTRNRGMNPSSQ